MYQEISKLIMYGNMDQDCILYKFADIFRRFEMQESSDAQLTQDIYTQIKRLLEVATDYGFDKNLWHNYLTFILITNENPFSITCEKVGANDGSVNAFAKNDFQVFMNLFHYDFSKIEAQLGINCFSVISDYKAIVKKELMYNKNVSEKVQVLSEKLAAAKDVDEFFAHVTEFYRAYGVGMFGLNKAFRITGSDNGKVTFHPINNMDKVMLDDLIGYEIQKKKLVENTEAFVQGRKANNALLFGDSGTGKSTSIKAIVNEYYDQGLRMIEIYKHQFGDLSAILAHIKNRNYRFIIFIDDLSFEENEVEYKFLKAVIEGGVETRPDNVLIYATSNRRHLIRETWNDRTDMEHSGDIHRSDTVEEKLSLAARFGVAINFNAPTPKEYQQIVLALAERQGVEITDHQQLLTMANAWEVRHGGFSGRTAQQFVHYLKSLPPQ